MHFLVCASFCFSLQVSAELRVQAGKLHLFFNYQIIISMSLNGLEAIYKHSLSLSFCSCCIFAA
jgi:hypothetical protein